MITRLQHHAARIVTGIFDFINFRGADLMETLGWHSFDNRRDYFTATMMFKCINGLVPLRLINELNVISDDWFDFIIVTVWYIVHGTFHSIK